MSNWSALHYVRIGCVQYLNAKPLIAPYDGETVFAHPSDLSRMLEAGELDAALIPIFDALRHPEYRLVDNVAITSRGPVYSVFLAWKGPLAKVRRVALDPASRTSAHLVQVILAEFYGMRPEFVATTEPHDAKLLIGNQAIAFRKDPENKGEYHFMDLGEEWTLHTGLPMVYAGWALRGEVAESAVGNAFRALKEEGLEEREAIAQLQPDPAFALDYLTRSIQYDLGEEEKKGIQRFAELLTAHVTPVRFENAFV